jgi:hypothetical protein
MTANQPRQPDDSGKANDFLNEFSGASKSNEKLLLIKSNSEIGTTSDSLQMSDNSKSLIDLMGMIP